MICKIMTFMNQWFFVCVCAYCSDRSSKKQIYAGVNTGQLRLVVFWSFLGVYDSRNPALEDDFQNDVTVDKLDTLGEQSSSE